MKNTQWHPWKALRVALYSLVGMMAASALAGCAASPGASHHGGSSRVEVYGEIDVGYGTSRTKTTLHNK